MTVNTAVLAEDAETDMECDGGKGLRNAVPMLFGTLVTVSGFVPIGFARSSVGEYAGNIFWVLAYALIISWLVAVTFTPYLGVRLLREPGGTGHGGDPYDTPR